MNTNIDENNPLNSSCPVCLAKENEYCKDDLDPNFHPKSGVFHLGRFLGFYTNSSNKE
jgi:hypothetical protein